VTQRTIDLSAGPIRYQDVGAGEPIVFVHGFAVNGGIWRRVVPALQGRYRCLVPDWPLGSHGVPMRPEADLRPGGLAALVGGFLAALELRGVTLVGNDLGGAVCQLVAARHPERLARLVLTPCDAFDNLPPPMFRYLVHLPRLPGVPLLLTQLLRLRPLQRLPMTYGWLTRDPLPDDVLERYARPMSTIPGVRRDAAKVFTALRPRYTQEVLPALARFDRPVLLAWARDDRFFPFAHAERLAGVFPRAELSPIEDARTLVSEDQPDRLARAIDDFCRRHPLGA